MSSWDIVFSGTSSDTTTDTTDFTMTSLEVITMLQTISSETTMPSTTDAQDSTADGITDAPSSSNINLALIFGVTIGSAVLLLLGGVGVATYYLTKVEDKGSPYPDIVGAENRLIEMLECSQSAQWRI